MNFIAFGKVHLELPDKSGFSIVIAVHDYLRGRSPDAVSDAVKRTASFYTGSGIEKNALMQVWRASTHARDVSTTGNPEPPSIFSAKPNRFNLLDADRQKIGILLRTPHALITIGTHEMSMRTYLIVIRYSWLNNLGVSFRLLT